MRNSNYKEIRSSAVLTGSYVAGTVIDEVHRMNQITLICDYTQGSATSLEIKVEVSKDKSEWYQEVNVGTASGTNTIYVSEYTYTGGDTKFSLELPVNANYVRVSFKVTGTATGSDCVANAFLGYV